MTNSDPDGSAPYAPVLDRTRTKRMLPRRRRRSRTGRYALNAAVILAMCMSTTSCTSKSDPAGTTTSTTASRASTTPSGTSATPNSATPTSAGATSAQPPSSSNPGGTQPEVPDSELLPAMPAAKTPPTDSDYDFSLWMDKLETSARAGGTAGSIAVAEEFRQAGASVVDGDLNGKVVIPAMSPAIGVSIEAAEVRGVAEKMAAGYSYSLNAMLASLLQLSGVKPDQAALATASRAAMDGLTQHPGEGTTARVLSTILSAPTVTDQPEGNIDDVILNPVQMTLVWHLLISDLHDKALGYNPAAGVTTAATPTPLRTALMTAEPGSCVEEKEIQNITNSFFTTSFGGIVEKSIDILSEQLVEEAIESAEKSGTDTNAETNLGRFKLASGLIDVGLAIGILVWTVNLFGAHIAFEKNPLVRTKTTDKYLDEEKLTTTAMYRSAFGDNGEMSACLAIVAALFGKDVDLPNNGEAGPAKGVGVTWKLASGGLETGVTGVTDRGAVELCYSECGNVSTHTDDAGQNQITLRGLPQQHDKANTKTSYNRTAQVYATFDPGDLANDALNNWSHLLSLIKIAIPAFNGNAAGATATALTQMLSRSGLLRTPITSVPVRAGTTNTS